MAPTSAAPRPASAAPVTPGQPNRTGQQAERPPTPPGRSFAECLGAPRRLAPGRPGAPAPDGPAPGQPPEGRPPGVGAARDPHGAPALPVEPVEERRARREPAADDAPPAPPAEPWADPLQRSLAQPVAPLTAASGPAPVRELPPAVEAALTRLVRRVAWGGDGRRAGASIEIGAGPLAGARIAVRVGEGGVVLEIDGAGADGEPLAARLAARLAAQGLPVEELRVA